MSLSDLITGTASQKPWLNITANSMNANSMTATTTTMTDLNILGNITSPALVSNGADLDLNGNVDLSGNLIVDSTTDSTSSITGALIVSGGVGIAKNVYGLKFFGLQNSGHYYTAKNTADQVIGAGGSTTALLFPTAVVNAGITYNAGVFTVTQTGVYSITAYGIITAVTNFGSANLFLIGVNGGTGADQVVRQDLDTVNTTSLNINMSVNTYLVANDTVGVYAYSTDGLTVGGSFLPSTVGITLVQAL